MTKASVSYIKSFSNVDEVFDALLKHGFFVDESHRDVAKSRVYTNHEHWYTNKVVEIKILRGYFGSFELSNYRRLKHKVIEEIFAVATLPKL